MNLTEEAAAVALDAAAVWLVAAETASTINAQNEVLVKAVPTGLAWIQI